ncbi:unnamed protein product [Gadus morhua 'NCC']
MDSSPDRCRTCAVVGNSVNLLRSHYGPLIDLHDVIMRCVTEDDDPWFTKRFDASLKTFLTRNNTLSERDFRWWKNLQFGNKAFPSYRMAEMKVFEIFPQQESFMDSSPDRCRTCAVVGNSVNLLGSHYGPLIDFHDVIMRFNTARTVGYEGDVGNKTTLHIMYPESAVDLDDHTHLILFPFKIRDLEWLVSAFTTKSVKIGRGIPRYSHSGNGPSPNGEVRQVKQGLRWGRIQGDIPGRDQADTMFVEAPDGKDDHRKVGKHRSRPGFVVAPWLQTMGGPPEELRNDPKRQSSRTKSTRAVASMVPV